MDSRLSMVLDLDVPEESLPEGISRAQQIAAMRLATMAVKQKVLPHIEALRRLDPELEIQAHTSIFPVLIVRTTPEVFALLRQIPSIVRMSPSREAELLHSASPAG